MFTSRTALIVISTLFSIVTVAKAGGDQGNGGDTYALQFAATGERVYSYLLSSHASSFNLNRLKVALETTKVESTNHVLSLSGVPKDAINYPVQHRIIFNRKRWVQMGLQNQPTLVLHEYLGIIGIEDASYSYTKQLLSSFAYNQSAQLDCQLKDGSGILNFGIDESTGAFDTIILTEHFAISGSMYTNVLTSIQPTGRFSQMVSDGAISIPFGEDVESTNQPIPNADLISVHRPLNAQTFDGYLSHQTKLYPLTCVTKEP